MPLKTQVKHLENVYLCQGQIVARMPYVASLIVGWTIYREFQYQLCSKGMWPFAVLNNKHCGKNFKI